MNIKLAWRNLWRNKRRSLITIASITFAVFFACLMLSMQLGTYEKMIDNAVRFHTGYIQIHQQGYWEEKTLDNSFVYDDSLRSMVKQTKNVQDIVPRLESFALASYRESTKGAMVIGMDPEAENILTNTREKMVEGSYLQSGDQQALISQGLADYLDIGINDTLVLISQGFRGINSAGKYAVKGIVKIPSPELNNQLVYLPLTEAQWFYGAEQRLTALALVVAEADDVKNVIQSLQGKLPREKYEVMGWREMMPELVQSIELDYVSGVILLYILYAVIGFGIFGTFLMMTNERVYEFGILLSIGMKRFRLQAVMFLEIIFMGLLGVLAGVLISFPILLYFFNNPVQMGGEYAELYEQFGMEPILPFSLDPVIFLRQAIVVLIMSLLIGIYPMVKIYKLDPARAIRN
ncbi:MAG: ABC transporter permease [Candidatus Cyclobacteriaceae bacterium M3_2C_046]